MSRKPIIDPKAVEALGKIAPASTQPRTRGRPDLPFVRGTVLVPRDTYARLKTLAAEHHTNIQGLFEQAMDAWLASRGEPPFFPEEWKGWTGKGKGDDD
jgi:hypothetical protein